MELQKLIYAVNTRKRRRALNPYSPTLGGPPPDRRRRCFRRWQQMRRASTLHQTTIAVEKNQQKLCECGAIKMMSMPMCYACKDMWTLICQRIEPQTVRGDVAERYELPPLGVYSEPGRLIRPRKHLDDASSWQENAIRLMEDNS